MTAAELLGAHDLDPFSVANLFCQMGFANVSLTIG
jgi:hypothetical protein